MLHVRLGDLDGRQLFAGVIGNALETCDFAICGSGRPLQAGPLPRPF